MMPNYRGFQSRLHMISPLSSVFSPASWGLFFQSHHIPIECMPKLEGQTILHLMNVKTEASSFNSVSSYILTFPLSTYTHTTQKPKSPKVVSGCASSILLSRTLNNSKSDFYMGKTEESDDRLHLPRDTCESQEESNEAFLVF